MKTRVFMAAMLAAAVVVAAPLGTEFTYQGVLSDGGSPAAGAYDLRCILYDAEAGGSQVGNIVYVEDLAVTDGRFTTQLDFGAVFGGTALWLEIAVRDGGTTGGYTVLSPRQELTAAPFAQHAQAAETATTAGHAITADSATAAAHATTAGDSDLLDGQDGAFYLTWSNFVGIPGDIADGDDDTLADLSCGTDEIARWTGTAWVCSDDDDTPFVRTYVVGPVGTPTENGAAFEVAMGAISPPPSSTAPVLVRIEPGTYDFGTSAQAIVGWTTYEGAGRGVTRLTSAVCSASFYSGTFETVLLGEYPTFRHLAIENTCADPGANSIALSNQHDFMRIEDVDLEAAGVAEKSIALYNSGSSLMVRDSKLVARHGVDSNQGMMNEGAGVNLVGVVVESIGGVDNWGINNDGTDFTFQRGRVGTIEGSESSVGIVNWEDAENLRVEDSRINEITSSAFWKAGVTVFGADITFRNVEISGYNGIELTNYSESFANAQLFDVYVSATEYALTVNDQEDNGCMVMIDDGRYNAGVDAVLNIGDTCDVRIGGAYLANGVTGTALCAGVHDWGHTFYPNTCPP